MLPKDESFDMPIYSNDPPLNSILAEERGKPQPLESTTPGLPNELILHILDLLDDAEVYNLALSCKRLHYIVLPIYFSRPQKHSFMDLQNKALLISSGWDYVRCCSQSSSLLRGVRICLFVTSLKSLICHFACPEPQFLWQIRTLYRVLEKLTHVEEVELDFSGVPISWKSSKKPTEWLSAFLRILEMLSVRSCTTVTIHNNEGLFIGQWTSIFKPLPIKRSIASVVKAFLSGRKKARPAYTSIIAREPMLKRVVDVFNASTITTLTVTNLRVNNWYTSHWSPILPDITLPKLTHLTVSTGLAFVDELTVFLCRHPTIQELRYDHSLTTECELVYPAQDSTDLLRHGTHLPPDALPHLTTLVAPELYVMHLFSPANVLKFPELRQLKMSVATTEPSDHVQYREFLAPIAYRLSNLDLSLRMHLDSSWASSLVTEAAPTGEAGIPPCFRHAHSIEIQVIEGLSTQPRAFLPRWLSLFSQLKELVIEGRELPASGEVDELTRNILAACKGLQYVEVNGERASRGLTEVRSASTA